MARPFILRVALSAIVLAAATLASPQSAQAGYVEPIANRYEPYANYYMLNAVNYTQDVVLAGNFSNDALFAYFYATLSATMFNQIWADELLSYHTYGMTFDQYQTSLGYAAAFAYQSSQYASKVYMASPNNTTQAASGWSYYGAYAAYLAYISTPPAQFIYNSGAPDVFHMRIRAFYSGRHLTFLAEDAQLSIAAQHHANYMAANSSTAAQEVVNGVTITTPAIVAANSTFKPAAGTPYGVVTFKMSTGANLLPEAFLSQFYTPIAGNVIGIGQSTAKGFDYYCVYVATKN